MRLPLLARRRSEGSRLALDEYWLTWARGSAVVEGLNLVSNLFNWDKGIVQGSRI